MSEHKKQDAPEGVSVDQAGGLGSTGKSKSILCGTQSITAVCRELAENGVGLRNASGSTQLETLPKALAFRGSRGLNTYEGTAAGYLRLATRVKELKDVWDIYTLKEDVTGPDGLLHKGIARYVLRGRRHDLPKAPARRAQGGHLQQPDFKVSRAVEGQRGGHLTGANEAQSTLDLGAP